LLTSASSMSAVAPAAPRAARIAASEINDPMRSPASRACALPTWAYVSAVNHDDE